MSRLSIACTVALAVAGGAPDSYAQSVPAASVAAARAGGEGVEALACGTQSSWVDNGRWCTRVVNGCGIPAGANLVASYKQQYEMRGPTPPCAGPPTPTGATRWVRTDVGCYYWRISNCPPDAGP
jgi:hypothetical protein